MTEQEREEREFTITSMAEWDRNDAYERGFHRKDQQWVLSDRDVWYKNPYYHGPDQPHPEYPE